MGIEKSVEIAQAKKRRSKFLHEFNLSGMSMRKFATKKKVSAQRMSQLLKLARGEAHEAI
jgi:hypothetical protein